MRIGSRHSRSQRSGVVLYAVLVALSLLSLAAFQFSDLMVEELTAAHTGLRATQARAVADSGLYSAIAMLSDADTVSGTLNNNVYDNDSSFHGVRVQSSDDQRTGRYSIV